MSSVFLKVTGVAKSYGRTPVLSDISFSASAGSVVAVTGQNGIGKTTLLKILAGVTPPSSGTVSLGFVGEKIREIPLHPAPVCSYAGPSLRFYDELTVFETLRFVRRLAQRPESTADINEIVEASGLAGRLDDRVGSLSSGLLQRLRLLVAIDGNPDLLLLDEPRTNLDRQGVDEVAEIVARFRRHGSIVCLATNEPDDLALCDFELRLDRADTQSV